MFHRSFEKAVDVTFYLLIFVFSSQRTETVAYLEKLLGKLWSIFIVLIFEIIGNISYLSKYILGFKVLLLLVLYRISFNL